MAEFSYPPTYRQPVEYDSVRQTWTFDVQWLQWFRDLAANLTAANGVTTTGTGSTVLQDTPTIITPIITGVPTTSDATFLAKTSVALPNAAGGAAGTLLNSPAAGNPTKWISINDNGVTRRIPTW